MTAEIAILNRSAIAFAADSAVTVSVGNKTKVYDTAEKLFELTRRQPIAIMIYNNVEVVGVPLDVMVRKFRAANDKAGVVYQTMKDASDQFIEYMRSFDHEIEEEKRYLRLVLRDRFKMLNKRFEREAARIVQKFSSENYKDAPSPQDVLIGLIKEEATYEAAFPLAGFLDGVTITKFRRRYADTVKTLADEILSEFFPPTAAVYRELDKLALNIVKSRNESPMMTGMVFGGFAEKDMFPTMRYIEFDGIYFDEIKIISENEIDIDRKSTRAAVMPFAQKEMVERFMDGLDAELEEEISTFVSDAVSQIIDAVAKDLDRKIETALKRKVQRNFSSMMEKLKLSSRRDLLDVVYFMSKKELADMAHALVELTSQKRRFSTDAETVGGPIDVAILTKNEGFIWIRRKHYFDSELNPTCGTPRPN